MERTVDYWVRHLDLKPHPEGGYYRETYRSKNIIPENVHQGERNISTAIYFLLTSGNFSAFHKIKSDEMWHWYAGQSLTVYILQPEGSLQKIKLGLNLEAGEVPQAVVPANHWFASRVEIEEGYGLVGCTVAPGFDFNDFELGTKAQLSKEFPDHSTLIEELTRM